MSPDDLSREWALKARAGDESAFAELVRAWLPAAYRVARQITRDPAEAEDAVQEAFLRAHRALHRFDPARPFGPWILTIAARRALTRARRRRRDAPLEAAAAAAEPAAPREAGLSDALDELSPADRAILVLKYKEGLSVSEIARALDIGEPAVKVRLFRARERLMKRLAER